MDTPGSLLSSAPPRRGADLGPADWLRAGQERLKHGGLRAMKLRALATDLGVSTGSFYHHFASFDAYSDALARFFADEQVAEVEDPAVAALPALERVRELVAFVLRNDRSRLSLAMRAWAESDERARAAVRRNDAAIRRFLTGCLAELGFGEAEAEVRAYALMAVGHGAVTRPDLPLEELREGLIRLLCLPPAAASSDQRETRGTEA